MTVSPPPSSSSPPSISPAVVAASGGGAAGITTDDQTNAAQRRAQGEFVRGVSSARNWITKDPPPTHEGDATTESAPVQVQYYPPAAGRYHLYVAYNCPWCHRVLLARAILGLEEAISVDVVYPNRSNEDEPLGENLWKFLPEGQIGGNGRRAQFPECTVDTVFGGKKYIKEIYEAAGIFDQKSVPILVDKETKTIVSNESAEIVRMFGVAMKEFGTHYHSVGVELYPSDLAAKINEINDWVYTTIANGSYKAGFSSNQDVYEGAYQTYFETLAKLNDDILAHSKFLVGDQVTEADIRLFPPLFRHDPVYYNRFKLNEKYLWEYPNIWRWMNDMIALEGMEAVSNSGYLAHCKQGYFGRTGNGTIPVGPKGYPDCYKIPNWNPTSGV